MIRRYGRIRSTVSRILPWVTRTARSLATSSSHEASSGPRTWCATHTAAVATRLHQQAALATPKVSVNRTA